jgi:hypothetical protein
VSLSPHVCVCHSLLMLVCLSLSTAWMEQVLECLYSGKLVAEEDLIPSILHLSTKLMLPAIRSACVAHLVSRVSEATMGQVLCCQCVANVLLMCC